MKNSTKIVLVLTIVLGVLLGVLTYINKSYRTAIILDAPDTYRAGELVLLDASESDASNLFWKIIPDNVNFKIIANGKKAIFVGNQPNYTIILAGSINNQVQVIFHEMKLGSGSTIIKSDLVRLMSGWVPEDRTHDEVIRLAQSFRSVARIIEASNLTNIDEIIQATAWSNKDALGPSVDKWKSFLLNLQEYLESNPPNNHAMKWREIAQALEAVDQVNPIEDPKE